jgi:hypothetical protein
LLRHFWISIFKIFKKQIKRLTSEDDLKRLLLKISLRLDPSISPLLKEEGKGDYLTLAEETGFELFSTR